MKKRILDILHLISVRFLMRRIGVFGFPEVLQPLSPIELNPDSDMLLVVSPHFDDETFGAFGLMQDFHDRGGRVVVVCVHDIRDAEYQRRYEEWLRNLTLYATEAKWCCLDDLEAELGATIGRYAGNTVALLPSVFDYHHYHRSVSKVAIQSIKRFRSCSISAYFYCVYSAVGLSHFFDISDLVLRKKGAIERFEIEMEKKNWAHVILGQNAFLSRYINKGKSEQHVECFVKVY
jgi:hypothetical protein